MCLVDSDDDDELDEDELDEDEESRRLCRLDLDLRLSRELWRLFVFVLRRRFRRSSEEEDDDGEEEVVVLEDEKEGASRFGLEA